jgi:hypothetical protein
MKLYSKIFLPFTAAALCLMSITEASAQKNTDISAGVKAPAGIKVDGKHTEWGTLPAYNKSTTLRYTLANDANNLYLAITTTDQPNINKLLGGGLTLSVNRQGKKNEEDAAVIEYPMAGQFNARSFRGGRGGRQGDAALDTAAIIAARKQAITAAKELSITGVKEITDTLVSIYNTYGIKTGITIDNNGSLYYELAVPLKLLELSAEKATEIAYNIKLNGIQFGGGNRQPGGNRQGGGRQGGGDGGGGFNFGGGGGQFMELMTPTDFWGKYKLAKP